MAESSAYDHMREVREKLPRQRSWTSTAAPGQQHTPIEDQEGVPEERCGWTGSTDWNLHYRIFYQALAHVTVPSHFKSSNIVPLAKQIHHRQSEWLPPSGTYICLYEVLWETGPGTYYRLPANRPGPISTGLESKAIHGRCCGHNPSPCPNPSGAAGKLPQADLWTSVWHLTPSSHND